MNRHHGNRILKSLQGLLLCLVLTSPGLARNASAAGADPAGAKGKAAPARCDFAPWPFARNQSPEDLQRTMEQAPRDRVESYFLYEVSHAPQARDLMREISTFLIHTEQHKDKRAFYQLVVEAARSENGAPRRKLDSKELCEILLKIR